MREALPPERRFWLRKRTWVMKLMTNSNLLAALSLRTRTPTSIKRPRMPLLTLPPTP